MDLGQEQQRRNAQADDTWTLYASHRSRVTQLLLNARSPSADRLCLLGAGNLNDFDLPMLLTVFREIVLVDLDAGAVLRGLIRQGVADDLRIRVLAPIDVTGVFAELSQISSGLPAGAEQLDGILPGLGRSPQLDIQPCDVVASVGLLTQLIEAVLLAVGESHPRFWDVVSAMRAQHLRLMLELTRPGGAAVLVTEVVSSDSCPALRSASEADLLTLLPREIAARNFYTGTNPAALRELLQTDVGLTTKLADVKFTQPWLWSFVARIYAVYGVVLRKRNQPERASVRFERPQPGLAPSG